MQAVILAGGLGTRLQPYTFFIPKPMLPLGNKPLLEYLIEWIKKLKNIDRKISLNPQDVIEKGSFSMDGFFMQALIRDICEVNANFQKKKLKN